MTVEEKKAKAHRYFCMGLNSKEIGKLLDISYRTVQSYMSAGGWNEAKEPHNLKRRAFEMHGNGFSYSEIAKVLQVSKSTVYLYLREVRQSQT